VQDRVILVASLLVLAGCGGAPAGDQPTESATVTPAPVPAATGAQAGVADGLLVDAPEIGIVNGTVDGARLGASHADRRGVPHTRTHAFRIRSNGTALLTYRGVLTLVGSESRLRRIYRGPEAARYLPGRSNATQVHEERYTADGTTLVRRTVDGISRAATGAEPPRLRPPVDVTNEGTLVEALLDDATVIDDAESAGYRVSSTRMDPVVVPRFLDDPRNGTVEAVVRDSGRVARIDVRYEATMDGRAVTVEITLSWDRPGEAVKPGWVGE
jgi:hypothetical protein